MSACIGQGASQVPRPARRTDKLARAGLMKGHHNWLRGPAICPGWALTPVHTYMLVPCERMGLTVHCVVVTLAGLSFCT